MSSGLLALLIASSSGISFLFERDLFFVEQDVGVFELDGDFVLIGDEVRREEAAVELHAFDDFDGRLAALAFFDRDHAVLADLEEGIGQHRRRSTGRCCRRSWRSAAAPSCSSR